MVNKRFPTIYEPSILHQNISVFNVDIRNIISENNYFESNIFTLAESLGGVESLICHPAKMTHASLTMEKREKLGISDGDEFNNLISKIGLNKEFINKKIEIEILWNQLIYQFYNDKIIIDENKLKDNLKKKISKKINSLKQYLLYEILFSANTIKEFENEYDKIKKSINEIGFESTANIFSNSKSAMYGGKIGWVNENQLSKSINKNTGED